MNDSGHPRPRTSPRARLHRLLPVTVVMGDDSDSDEILMSEDATNWRSVGKSVNPLAEIAKITKGRAPRTRDRKPILGNSTNTAAVTPAGTASTIPAPRLHPRGGTRGVGGVGGARADPRAQPHRERRGPELRRRPPRRQRPRRRRRRGGGDRRERVPGRAERLPARAAPLPVAAPGQGPPAPRVVPHVLLLRVRGARAVRRVGRRRRAGRRSLPRGGRHPALGQRQGRAPPREERRERRAPRAPTTYPNTSPAAGRRRRRRR